MEVTVYQPKQSKLARIKSALSNKYAQMGASATVLAFTAVPAHAADDLDVTPITSAITSATSNAKLLFGAAMIILGIFVGWRYLKRGANSA